MVSGTLHLLGIYQQILLLLLLAMSCKEEVLLVDKGHLSACPRCNTGPTQIGIT